jgi:hypothetical protein
MTDTAATETVKAAGGPVTVINSGLTAYVVDDDGHVIAPGERLTVDGGGQRAQHGVLAGHLRVVAPPAPSEPVDDGPQAPSEPVDDGPQAGPAPESREQP